MDIAIGITPSAIPRRCEGRSKHHRADIHGQDQGRPQPKITSGARIGEQADDVFPDEAHDGRLTRNAEGFLDGLRHPSLCKAGDAVQHPDYRHSDQASLDGRAARHTNARHVVELLILLSSQIA